MPRKSTWAAIAILIAAYACVRLFVLENLLPGPYDPDPVTLLVRMADFLAGGALFFMVAHALAGFPDDDDW